MSAAIRICLSFSLCGRASTQERRSFISMAETCAMVFSSTLKQRASLLSLVPPQTGQVTLSSISPTKPGKASISEEIPSPTRKSSSEPKTISDMASSGTASIGS